MGRIIAVYGTIGGLVLASSFLVGWLMGAEIDDHNVFVGYSIMLVALSMVFVGVKKYRDTVLGGVIRFWPAAGVGLGIAAVASLFYVIGWEIYMYATDYSFMRAYVDSSIAAKQAAGVPAAEVAKFAAEMKAFEAQYADPLFRMVITLTEIAPVGLLVAILSAALLRKSSFMPAKANN
ncbi:MAG TPA: DUF4199 domain-containing protein [Sphingorhabdus sp.]|nr:DUF4199 domain-containing protein [Sphingorhabdus sp.]